MLRKRTNKIVSVALLIYFALFIVPPVSSFASRRENCSPKTQVGGKTFIRHQTAQFLFDFIAWQQFKKAKQSDVLTSVHFSTSRENGPVNNSFVLLTAAAVLGGIFSRSVEFCRLAAPSHRVRSSLIVFSRSGCSPPAPSFC